MLNGAFIQWGGESYLSSLEKLPAYIEAHVSLVHNPFKISALIFIWAGTAEAFFGDIETFAEEMASI